MRKFTLTIFLFLNVCAVIVLPGCNRRPKSILSEKEMVALLTDLQMAEAYYNTGGPSVNLDRNSLVESVLKKHGVSHTQLDSTLAYYGRNMDEYYMLYQKVEKNLKAENNRLEELDAANDIWPYSHYAAVFPNQLSEGIMFSMPASGVEPGNSLEWRLRLNTAVPADGLLGVEYENGLTSYVKKSLSGDNALKMNIQTDTALVAKRIFGSISFSEPDRYVWADSIRLIRLDLDSLNYNQIRQQRTIHKM